MRSVMLGDQKPLYKMKIIQCIKSGKGKYRAERIMMRRYMSSSANVQMALHFFARKVIQSSTMIELLIE